MEFSDHREHERTARALWEEVMDLDRELPQIPQQLRQQHAERIASLLERCAQCVDASSLVKAMALRSAPQLRRLADRYRNGEAALDGE